MWPLMVVGAEIAVDCSHSTLMKPTEEVIYLIIIASIATKELTITYIELLQTSYSLWHI